MKLKIETPQEVEVELLIVNAGVRYWEDAEVNGVQDENGDLIPLRQNDIWAPSIELKSGRIRDWPQGVTADIHYKVCDAGEYWLADSDGRKVLKWKGYYVPDSLLCVGDHGYGDYIILHISEDGRINGWKEPHIDSGAWELEPTISEDRT